MTTFFAILFLAVLIVPFAVIKIRKDLGHVSAAASELRGKAGRLRGFGVVVDGGSIRSGRAVLGPLAGARAEVTDGTSRHTLTRVVTVAGALTKKTSAEVIISTANGGYHQRSVNGAGDVRRAQAWVIRFNAMAATAAQPGS